MGRGLVSIVAGVLLLALGACSGAGRFHGIDLSGATWNQASVLTDHHGQLRKLDDYRDKAVVIVFGYTYCPSICPTTLITLNDAMQRLGADAARVQVLFVTLDPGRDTQQRLAEYMLFFNPSFTGLRGEEAVIAAVAKDFNVRYARQQGNDPDGYAIDHTTFSYAIDPQGQLRLAIRYGETPAHIAADLKRLLAGK